MFQDVPLQQTLKILLHGGQNAVTASRTIENEHANGSKRQILSNSHADEESISWGQSVCTNSRVSAAATNGSVRGSKTKSQLTPPLTRKFSRRSLNHPKRSGALP